MPNVIKLPLPDSSHEWYDGVCEACGVNRLPETEIEPCAGKDFETWNRHIRRKRENENARK